MIIKIPFKTPTVNHLYGRHGNRSYLKPEAKKLKAQIVEIGGYFNDYLPLIHKRFPSPLRVRIEVHEDWYCKNGSVKKKDIDNRAKFMLDSVFEGLGIDDKFIFSLELVKVQDVSEYAVVHIEPIA